MYVCVCGGRGRGFNKTLLQQQSRGEKADSAVHYELLISKVVGERSTHNIRRSRQTSYILHGHTFSHTCSEERSHAPPPHTHKDQRRCNKQHTLNFTSVIREAAL